MEYAKKYKYLGVYFDEFLEFHDHCKILSEAGTRALGSIICKFKYSEDITYETFTKCVHYNVNPVTDYGSEIWGYLRESCTDQVQLKAIRSYLGVHKYAPNLAILGDMGWTPSDIRRKINLIRYWNRLIKLDDDRLTKHVFISEYQNGGTWCEHVKKILYDIGMNDVYDSLSSCDIDKCSELLLKRYSKQWKQQILQKPKLRTYCLLKDNFGTENYVRINLSRSQRSLLAQIRFGILPLHIETGRFRGLDPKYRTCHFCGEVEDELHFLFSCKQYFNIRKSFLSSLTSIVEDSQANCFKQLCDKYARRFSKYINSIWQSRKEHMFE